MRKLGGALLWEDLIEHRNVLVRGVRREGAYSAEFGKPPLPTSHSTPALLRKVRKGPTGAERDGQGNEVAKATELSTSCTDKAGNLSNASRWGRRGASEPSPLHIAVSSK